MIIQALLVADNFMNWRRLRAECLLLQRYLHECLIVQLNMYNICILIIYVCTCFVRTIHRWVLILLHDERNPSNWKLVLIFVNSISNGVCRHLIFGAGRGYGGGRNLPQSFIIFCNVNIFLTLGEGYKKNNCHICKSLIVFCKCTFTNFVVSKEIIGVNFRVGLFKDPFHSKWG